MANRNRANQQFDGRVRHWEKEWVTVKQGAKPLLPPLPGAKPEERPETSSGALRLLTWVKKETRCPEYVGPRHPHIQPVRDPRNHAQPAAAAAKPVDGLDASTSGQAPPGGVPPEVPPANGPTAQIDGPAGAAGAPAANGNGLGAAPMVVDMTDDLPMADLPGF